jgi:transglutaminase-like putative cysteine protease
MVAEKVGPTMTQLATADIPSQPRDAAPPPPPPRRLEVRHSTRYTYDRPVTRSTHKLHLRPVTDRRQSVREFHLDISPQVQLIEYDDVFGNAAARFEMREPYTELSITARSIVEIVDEDPFAFASVPIRPQFPLVWMPWQRMMLEPYLQPVELPESQLQVIIDYAMGYVERNNRDLMETLFAINLGLYRELSYTKGSTTVETSPYEVLMTGRGVCQDFANLFISMARLLGIPARYMCGYLYSGGLRDDGQRNQGCEASHAWVELYIPNVGWKGFDPTNGKLAHLDHVRVACGRHYLDTAPTAGTLFSAAEETMVVDVEVIDRTEPTLSDSPC